MNVYPERNVISFWGKRIFIATQVQISFSPVADTYSSFTVSKQFLLPWIMLTVSQLEFIFQPQKAEVLFF